MSLSSSMPLASCCARSWSSWILGAIVFNATIPNEIIYFHVIPLTHAHNAIFPSSLNLHNMKQLQSMNCFIIRRGRITTRSHRDWQEGRLEEEVPAAAKMPTWRRPPPSILRFRRASVMNSLVPQRIEPVHHVMRGKYRILGT